MDKIFDIINKEKYRQETSLELIPSENYVSEDVMKATWSILTNKYSEWYPWKRYYWWQEYTDEIENLAIERARKLFWAEYINVQPLSWSPANLEVYIWLLEYWDTVLWLSLAHWWHLTHWHPLSSSWILYNFIPYFVDEKTELIDMDEVEKIAIENKPKMILAWFSAYSRNIDWKRFREIADKVWAILMADISHIAWLIAWWVLENPIPYCDVVTTTTHKTLRWPRWAIIMSKKEFEQKLAKAVFPWIQWGPHMNNIAAKAIAFNEALQPEFKEYSKQVIANAKVLASELQSNWFRIISWWTDNHIVLIDMVSSYNIAWKEAEIVLEKVWLTTNKNTIPYDKRKPLDPSWIRIWTPAITTRWMKENEMKIIAKVFYEAIKNKDNETKLEELKKEIFDLCLKFPIK